ncbi:MAG: hypothetical protein CBE24_06410 [bacterium TMED264]|nr:MAG: hypothetical protein CBE24_06410 [bacterium TMED264]|tara:strand:- start:1071 stop:1763 length:693 start_codon:yes stop_codon:yes gene_type:complete
MKLIFLLLSIITLSSCSRNELIIKTENDEKFIIDKLNLKNQIFYINDLIDYVSRAENNKIKKLIENQENDEDLKKQVKNNLFLKKKLAESQNLIKNNCGQWYRPELCNRGMDNLDKDKELLVMGEDKLKNIKSKNELILKNEREKKKNFINSLINENYAEIHFSKIIYNSKFVDIDKNKSILPAKSIICFNPVLQEKYYTLWKDYGKINKTNLNVIDKEVCNRLVKFDKN